MPDLLVIGAGLAGLTGALAAAEAGLSVKVIARGLGAQHWTSGALDVLGYLPGQDSPVEEPLTAAAQLPPDHPYHVVGRDRLASTLQTVADRLMSVGLPYHGDDVRRNLLLPSAVGAARPTFLAPSAQLAGRLDDPTPILLVGFRGVRDFYPTVAAEHLREQGYAVRADYLTGDLITSRREANTVQLAQYLEDPRRIEAVGKALAALVHPGERIGLPAILGLDHHLEVWNRLQEVAGAPIFEIPTLPPSVPGIRLHRALIQILATRHVRVEANMAAVGYGLAGDRIAWVETEAAARPLRHHAAAFLLTTGGILGGGFESDPSGRVHESLFDLPITVPQQRAAWLRNEFLDPRGQPVFEGGVPVGPDFRPVGPDGAPVYTNLWAAGSLLAHADPIRERSQEGVSIATSMTAGAIVGAGRPALAPGTGEATP
jgi:glycerol-3-phosphate dehydrogenase subunit B